MKTLNEVIKANECCDHGELDSRCEDCPYSGIGACCAERETDALHYLKEYRELTAELVELNDPLTWQELQRMECKPVYVVYHTMRTKGWALVEYADDDRIDFTTPSAMRLTVFERQMGKMWQAYRKERE